MMKRTCSWCKGNISKLRALVSLGSCRTCDLDTNSPPRSRDSKRGQKA